MVVYFVFYFDSNISNSYFDSGISIKRLQVINLFYDIVK